MEESKEKAYMSRELVTMRTDVFKDVDIESFVFENKNYLSCLVEEFEMYEMKRAISKAKVGMEEVVYEDITPPEPKKPSLKFEAITLDSKEKLDAVLSTIDKEAIVAFDTETTGLDTKKVKMVGFSFCMDRDKSILCTGRTQLSGCGGSSVISRCHCCIEKIDDLSDCRTKFKV